MPSGIRATVEFSNPLGCPVARISATAEAPVEAMRTAVSTNEAGDSVSEFLMAAQLDSEDEAVPIFSYGSTYVYRVAHDGDDPCPCECLGRFGSPVSRYAATDGTLTLVFHAKDYDELQAIIGELRENFPTLDIKRFIRSPSAGRPHDSVFVDRGQLTDRQLEIVTTAYEMGYFDRPREANATEIAAALDISPSTFAEHLSAAQRKLLSEILDADR